MTQAKLEDVYPLSPLQEGILFHTVMSPEAGDYVRQAVRRLDGDLDSGALRAAWQEAVDRHPILRTAFVWEGVDEPVQAVCGGVEVPFAEHDWRALAPAEREARLETYLAADRRRGFALDEAPLLRLALFRVGPASHLLVWTFHHLLLDGWSVSLVLQRVLASYLARVEGRPSPVPASRPYRDYIAWLRGRDRSGAEAFWRRELAGFTAPTPLPSARPAAEGEGRAPGVLADRLLTLPGRGDELSAFGRRHSLTVNTLVQGAWALLLARHAGAGEVVFGSTTSGRPTEIPGFERMVGLFINTLAVRAAVPAEEGVLPWLARFQEHQAAVRAYEHSPLVRVQGWSEVPRGTPLFESVVVFENYRVDEIEAPPEGALRVGESRFLDGSSFPLTLIVRPGPPLVLRLAYDRERFGAAVAGRLLGHLDTLLGGFTAAPEAALGALPILSPGERQQVLVEWNDRPRPPAGPFSEGSGTAPRTVDEPFAAHAARRPEAPAVIAGERVVSYGELEAWSGLLARRLASLGVGPEVRVAVCGGRSPAMVAGLLGVLRAGGAYVPLDPSYPAERLAFLLTDALASAATVEHGGPRVLLVEEATLAALPELAALAASLGVRTVPLDPPADLAPRLAPPRPAVEPEHPAYVIYTSGSTGRPKGVVVSHGAAIASAQARLGVYRRPVKAYLLASPFAFDSSVAGIFWTLWQGGALVLPADDFQQDIPGLAAQLARRRVSHMLGLPSLHSLLLAILEEGGGVRGLPDLEVMIVAGEACPPALVERHRALLPAAALFNEYGPTEAAVWASVHDCLEVPAEPPVPIGRPIPGYCVHLLGPEGAPVPAGVAAELLVGGPGLARGYLGRPGLTAERFVPDGVGRGSGRRLYRTGDLARRRPDGLLDFLGRIDHQVKVRGYRIELGEIEAALGRHRGVREAVAALDPGSGTGARIVAYLIPAGEPGPSVAELRAFLGAALPAYMVPAVFVSLNELPRTPNGKVDRRRLPAPGSSRLGPGGVRTAPRTPAEEVLAAVWRQVLRVDEVGVHDSFFELGGDSIIALQVVSRAHRAGVHVTPRQLFAHPTVAGLAAVAGRAPEVRAEQGRVTGPVPLTPIQHWFFGLGLAAPHHFNQALLLVSERDLAPGRLARAAAHLTAHHDALRLVFPPAGPDGARRQEHRDEPGEAPFACVDLDALQGPDAAAAVTAVASRVQAGFDLARGPLFRIVLMRGAGRRQRLLLAAHHLVVDGVSWRLLLEDLGAVVDRLERGRPPRLPAKTTSYRAWAERLEAYARTPRAAAEGEAWLGAAGGSLSPVPAELPGGANLRREAHTAEARLDAETTRGLLGPAPAAYHTRTEDLLLAALALTLDGWIRRAGGQARPGDGFLVELEGHGREDLFADVDLSRTVGWFTAQYPVRLAAAPAPAPHSETEEAEESEAEDRLASTLMGVKEAVRSIPGRGLSFGVLRYLGPADTRRRLAALPAPAVGFNYLGQTDSALAADPAGGAAARFRPAPESAGPTSGEGGRREHLLDVNAVVVEGQLHVRWTASLDSFRRNTLDGLAADYRKQLERLAAHCLRPGAGAYTPSDFPLAGLDAAALRRLAAEPATVEDLHRPTPLQEGMLFHSLYDPDSGEYVEQVVSRLVGDFDAGLFAEAWRSVLRRHTILRSSFHWRDLPRPVVRVEREAAVPLAEEDWRGLPAAEQEAGLARFLAADARRGFDLERAPLLRLALFRIADDARRLVWSFHHLLLDGQATSELAGEVFEIYAALAGGRSPRLLPARPYRDHAAWLAGRDREEAEAYWRRALIGFRTPTPIPADRSRQAPGAGQGGVIAERAAADLRLPAGEAEAVSAFARKAGLTLHTLTAGAWGLLLARLAGADEAVFGITVSSRSPELGDESAVLGLFLNTLPARVRTGAASTALWLEELQRDLADLRRHDLLPLARIRALAGYTDPRPLFESILVFESYPVEASLRPPEGELPFRVEDVRVTERTNYPLVAVAVPREGLHLKLTYDPRRLSPGLADTLLTGWAALLTAAAAHPERRPEDLPLPTGSEVRRAGPRPDSMPESAPAVDAPFEAAHRAILARAARTPDAVAVIAGGERLTFGALAARAEDLALHLRALGVGPETVVAFAAAPGAGRVVGLLGILLSGGAFLPLDPTDPPGRVAAILAEARPAVVVEAGASLPVTGAPVLRPAPDGRFAERADPAAVPGARGDSGEALPTSPPDTLAYVIYTSGSTGRPKGVAVSHGALAAHCRAMATYLELDSDDRVLQLAPLSFDPFLEQVLPSLAAGAAVVLRDGEVWSGAELRNRIAREGLTVLNLPTPYWRWAIREWEQLPPLPPGRRPRRVMPGGDRLGAEDLAAWRRLGLGGTRLLNFYGPTETVITATAWPVPEEAGEEEPAGALPIGPVLAPRHARVADRRGRALPPGVVGELLLGGCLARGYLGRPGPTAERFVPDPEPPTPGARLYRTGDLVRRTADGVLTFISRVDRQVKVRGFRVEPGEVEAALEALPGVGEAAVVAHRNEHGEARLAAWVTAAPGLAGAGEAAPALEVEELRRRLAERLPEAMRPTWLGVVPELPRTASGKVDRGALPEPRRESEEGGRPRTPPRTAAEGALARIWSEVLHVDPPGIHDDFFRLGGDSILSLQVVSRARRHGLVLTPRQVFEHPTVAALASVAGAVPAVTAEQGPVTGSLPTTPIQRRFFDQDLPEAHHFNQAVLLDLASAPPPERVAAAVERLVRHHDALRLRFPASAAGRRAETAPPGGAPVAEIVDLRSLPPGDRAAALEAAAEAAQRGLDLEEGPLARALVFDLGDGGTRLLIAVHHLAVDGVSWRILLEDLALLLGSSDALAETELPPKTTSFAEWARRLEAHAASPEAAAEADRWTEVLAAAVPLPRDLAGGANLRCSVETLTHSLSAEATADLLGPALGAYRSRVDELLLTALGRALTAWTGSPAVTVALEGHGREEIFPDVDLSRTVGWLTTLYPVRLDTPAGGDLAAAVPAVKEELRGVPHRGLGYGLLRHLAPEAVRDRLRAYPEPELVFNYLGRVDRAVAAGSSLRPAAESAGAATSRLGARPHLLEVNARVVDDRLEASWAWSSDVHHRSTIEALAEAFTARLAELAAHCTAPGAGALSPSDFPLAGLAGDPAASEHLARATAGVDDVEDLHPLSPLQEGILFQALLAPESGDYFEQVRARLVGEVDPERLAEAWRRSVERHPILRSSFAWKGLERPLARVHRRVELPFVVEDWRGLEAGEQERRLDALHRRDVERGFDLGRAPLLRLTLLRLGDREWHLVWSNHHLLLDGWSASALVGEVFEQLAASHAGRPSRLVPVHPFREHVAWLESRDPAGSEAFWRSELAGYDEPPAITGLLPAPRPEDSVREEGDDGEPGRVSARRRLGAAEAAVLEAFARRRGLTLNTLVSAAWAVLLARYAGRRDVVYGATVSGRPAELPGAEVMLGLFINTLPVRAAVDASAPLCDWLAAFQAHLTILRDHEHTSLARIQEWSDVPRGRSLFDTVLVFESYPVDRSLTGGTEELPFTVEDVTVVERSHLPLAAVAVPRSGLALELLFDPERLDAAAVERMAGHWLALVSGLAAAEEGRVGDLPLLAPGERARLLAARNPAETPFPRHATLPELFAEQAGRRPDAVAAVFAGRTVSYGALAARAAGLAGRLEAAGAGPETRVAVWMEPSAEMLAAFLAASAVGGAYLPLDPAWPDERLARLLADAGVAVVVTDAAAEGRMADVEARLAALGGVVPPRLPVREEAPPVTPVPADGAAALARAAARGRSHPLSLAYVIYTSGSTGRPKGVAVTHRAVARLVKGTDYRQLGPDDRVAQASNIAFDAATFEIWGALLNGGRLVGVEREELLVPARLARRLAAEAITDLFLTTALFNQLARSVPGAFAGLRCLLFGGERVEPRWAREVAEGGAPETFLHVYGPTECTTFATWHPVSAQAARRGEVPIGSPIANTALFLLSGRSEPVPLGLPGEILLGGDGLARGYLGEPGRTAERFVPDAVSGASGARLYATGDLGRRLPGGAVDFLGRVDHQVKLRGFRIELGEIEAMVEEHPGVRHAVAMVFRPTADERRLAVYVVPGEEGAPPSPDELRRFLSERLPVYMLPSVFVPLAALPLNANGKVDRRALPVPEAGGGEEGIGGPPEGDLETVVAELWGEVLGATRVGREDDFFLLGGNSLAAMRLAGRLEETFQVEVPLRVLFEGGTVARVAEALEEREAAPGQMRKVAQVLRRIRGLTPAEREALLAEKRRAREARR